jgi:beta-lactamase class A
MASTTVIGGKRRKRNFPTLSLISALMLAGAVGLLFIELINFSQQDSLIAQGITVAGVDVSGYTQRDAVTRWQQVYDQPIILYYDNNPIRLLPSDIGFRLNNDTMLANALSASERVTNFWGRFFNYLTGQQITSRADIPISYEYQPSLLRALLEDIALRYDRIPGKPGYDVQTLTVYAGRRGTQLNLSQATQLIEQALTDPFNRSVILPIGSSDTSQPSLMTLRQLIIDYLDSRGFVFDGQASVVSVFVMDLQTGEELHLLSDVAFSAASTIKLPILVDFYRFKNEPPSQDEAFIMANSLLCSRNSSSNLLLRLIGGGQAGDEFNGIRSVTNTTQWLGARNTYLSAPLDEGVASQRLGSIGAPPTNPNPNFNTNPDPFNQTTAEDMGTLLAQIYDCANYGSGLMTAFPNGEFTQNECRQMLELTSANDLLRLLQGGIPGGTRISHKNGWVTDMTGDAGIVYPANGRNYIISVFIWEEAEFQNYERLWPLVEGVSRATWNYFSPEAALLAPRADIPRTAQDCEGNYLPPAGQVNLDNIRVWQQTP